jgi:hypothetical protein
MWKKKGRGRPHPRTVDGVICTDRRGKKSGIRTFPTDLEKLLAIDPTETDETPGGVDEKPNVQRNTTDERRFTIESDHDLVNALLVRN